MKKNRRRAGRQRRNRRISAIIGMVFCFMVFSVTVYAGTVVHTDPYASHYLSCTSICEEKSGTAKTSGAVNPYNNYASVVIYGQDNKSQGTTYSIESETVENAEARLPAVATVRGKNLKKAVTYQALTDTSGAFFGQFFRTTGLFGRPIMIFV